MGGRVVAVAVAELRQARPSSMPVRMRTRMR